VGRVLFDRSTTLASTRLASAFRANRLRVRSSGPILVRTMRLGGVDKSDPLPLHEQVAAEVRRAIAEGEAGPGDRLPLARDLAAILGVNRNTVLRALHMLRDEGLLEFRRGHGIKVTGTKEKSDLLVQVNQLVAAARRSGYRKSELIAMIEAVKG
jgi:GntR family transcriptional regulator